MNAQSKHENLILLAEDTERQNYFNKMEKKEQLEEKMLNTYKVPCKAVTCMKVNFFFIIYRNLKCVHLIDVTYFILYSASTNGSLHLIYAEPKVIQ